MRIIGIIVRIDTFEKKKRTFVNQTYLNTIRHYGWTPLLLSEISLAKWYSKQCDALIVPGGYDMHGFYQDEPSHYNTTVYEELIDELDFTIIDAFVKQKKPILGICRGLQLLNCYFGGTLKQHMPIAHETSHFVTFQQAYIYPIHTKKMVNSYHHQCIDLLGHGFIPLALHEDQSIEAIIHETLPILAVQWHPELLKDDAIIPYFLFKFATCRFPTQKRTIKNITMTKDTPFK